MVGDISTRFTPLTIHGLGNGNIIVSWSEPKAIGILKISHGYKYEESVYFDRDKNGRAFKSCFCFAVDEDRSHIIQACRVDKAIYCFDFDGHPVFTYKHTELTSPRGVGIDEDGNIYICERENSCIHQVSPDGNLLRIIKKRCPKNPMRLTFKKNCSELVVANGSNTVFRMKHQI